MKNILYISFVDWFWIKQRPHHFVEWLSKDNKVIYFCMQAWRKNSNTIIVNEDDKKNVNLGNIEKGNITISRKKVIPLHRKFGFIENINDLIMAKRIKKIEKNKKIDIVIFTHPMQLRYTPLEILKNKTLIYDCMDDYEEFNYYDKEELLAYEMKLYKIVNKIVCSSDQLMKKLINRYGNNKEIMVINNGVDIINFNLKQIKNNKKQSFFVESSAKKVGYIGTISSWFDFELLRNVAIRNSNIIFYIIGPIENEVDVDIISNINNIKIIGSVSYDEVPNILNNLDVAIMSFKLNNLIEAVNPVKIYEYLAMGKKVLAIRYNETEKFKDYIELYNGEEEFEEKLLKLLSTDEDNKRKIDYANQNSWEKRVDTFYKFILS